MLEHLWGLHGIELVQHLKSAQLDTFGTLRVTAELQGFILSLLTIEEKYKSPYVVYPLEGLTKIHDISFYQDATAKLVVDWAIS
jgi:hypothetical protein